MSVTVVNRPRRWKAVRRSQVTRVVRIGYSPVAGPGGDGGDGSITVREVDGSPTGTASVVEVPNGTLTSPSAGVYRLGYEVAGTAAGLLALHGEASDPHPQYLTPTEANAAYSPISHHHDSRYYTETETDGFLDEKLSITKNLSDLGDVGTARDNLGLGNLDAVVFNGVSVGGLTAGRVVYAGTGGALSNDAGFVYNSGNIDLSNDRTVRAKDNGGTARRLFFLDIANNYGCRNEAPSGDAYYGIGNPANTGGRLIFQAAGNNVGSISPAGAASFDVLDGFRATVAVVTGTTAGLGTADSGRVIEYTSGSAVAVTLSASAAVGTTVTVTQAGAGQVTFSAASGATLRNRQSHTKTAGQWAAANLHVRANSGGSAAEWVLAGDTA